MKKKFILTLLLYTQLMLSSVGQSAPLKMFGHGVASQALQKQPKLLMSGQGGAAHAAMDPQKVLAMQPPKRPIIKQKSDREEKMMAQSPRIQLRFEKAAP